jgi:AraC family transcriptional activator of tynA and feaB
MKTIFSTEHVHQRERFDCWHAVACSMLVQHDSRPDCREAFRAELQAGDLDQLKLIFFTNSPMRISHGMRHTARAEDDDLFICRQFAGTTALEQCGRELMLGQGDMTVLDPALPYSGAFGENSQLLVLKVPRPLLEARVGKPRELAAYRIQPHHSEEVLLSSYLAQLPLCEGGLSQETRAIVGSQLLDLVTVVLTKLISSNRTQPSSARSFVRLMVHAVIDSRFADPRLEPETIAAAAGVSVRYANAVLAEDGLSIMRLLQAKRLEACRKALAAPALLHRHISEIAYSCGFSDMTHFGRVFKAAYGLLPRDYRKSVETISAPLLSNRR